MTTPTALAASHRISTQLLTELTDLLTYLGGVVNRTMIRHVARPALAPDLLTDLLTYLGGVVNHTMIRHVARPAAP